MTRRKDQPFFRSLAGIIPQPRSRMNEARQRVAALETAEISLDS